MKKFKYYFLSWPSIGLFFLTLSYFPVLKAEKLNISQSERLKKTALITYSSSKGRKIFYQSQYVTDFWPLSRYFVTQKNLTFCSIASAVMVLNALNIKAPLDKIYTPYRLFTQSNIFTLPSVKRVVNLDSLKKEGLTLDEFGQLMRQFPLAIKIFHAGNVSFSDFRHLAINAVRHPNRFVVVNIDRSLYGKKGGHFSPLAAYDSKTDRFLFMDVARYRYPPVWVKASDLFKAMNTIDTSSHQTRGFAILNK